MNTSQKSTGQKRTNTITPTNETTLLVKNVRMDMDYNSNYEVSRSSMNDKMNENTIIRTDQTYLPIPQY